MRNILITIFLIGGLTDAYGQIDYSKLIIGRNSGVHEFHDGETARIFGFAELLSESVKVPGPLIEITEGDSVKIDFWNVSQGAPHTIHLHGLDVNQQNDGVPSLSFDVSHMDHGYYFFKAPHPGTYLYHCHVASTIHVHAGMYGVIIVRPASGNLNVTWDGGPGFDQEHLLVFGEMDTTWLSDAVLNHPHDGSNIITPSSYSPQYFQVNGKSGSSLSHIDNYLGASSGDDVFFRLVNVGYQGKRVIFPTVLNATTISSDGRPFPSSFINDTVDVMPGERYGVMTNVGSDPIYPIVVQSLNLNTGVIESQDTVYLTTTLGLNDEYNEEIIVYPNPSEGVFFWELDHQYEVLDLNGKTLLKGEGKYVNIEDYLPGIYFLKLDTGTTVRLFKH